jgi:hypothetical protein
MTETVIAAAIGLGHAARWDLALDLLDSFPADAPLALAAAEVAVERDWYAGTTGGRARIDAAERLNGGNPVAAWDLRYLRARLEYQDAVFDGAAHGHLEDLWTALRDEAPDDVRRGWACFWGGVTIDRFQERTYEAHELYEEALAAGEPGDPLLAREALRHLGDHDHDNGDDEVALQRWRRSAALGAGAGFVPGTLAQQLLLAVLMRDTGDEPGAVALATEIIRWASALGLVRIAAQTEAFVAGVDPTARPGDETAGVVRLPAR